ncbi:MAG TPA: PPC domain-containing DNA-binding protein [Thermoanaerobaculia bacterium]|nr:PPC domain-containing DNA-binding protein [Thermoanaerobaculia bacterium]
MAYSRSNFSFAEALALTLVLCITGCVTPPTRAYALRLKPGDDLRLKLVELARQHDLRAAYVVTCVGSLRRAAIRFADQQNTTMIDGPLEIVSLVGTLSPDGPHLHISVSDAAGRTVGGHLAEGSVVYTTAEVVIGELTGVAFSRETDPMTTYEELVIK